MITERTKYFDPDWRGSHAQDKPTCIVCGKVVREPVRFWARIVMGGMRALHVDDIPAYEAKQAASAETYDRGDMYNHPVGPCCRKRHGLQDYTF